MQRPKNLQSKSPTARETFKGRVAVIHAHPFFPNSHCALSTWTHEVYQRLPDDFQCTVIAPITKPVSAPYLVKPVYFAGIWFRLKRALRRRNLKGMAAPIRRYASAAGGGALGRAAWGAGASVFHIHNDPELAIACREAAPSSFIMLHLNNNHLADCPVQVAACAVTAADRLFFCSKVMRENVLEKLPAEYVEDVASRSNVISNGASVLDPPPNWVMNTDRPEIVFIGRVIRSKGPHLLVEAMGEILHKVPNACLTIIGPIAGSSDPEHQFTSDLLKAASKFGRSVVLTDALPHDQTMARLRNADVFVCPSLWDEPFGMVNVEAMAAGVPVIAFENGGIPEVIGDAGILLQETSAGALAKAISGLILDPERARKLSIAGQERVKEKFSWEVISRQWNSRLHDAFGEKEQTN